MFHSNKSDKYPDYECQEAYDSFKKEKSLENYKKKLAEERGD